MSRRESRVNSIRYLSSPAGHTDHIPLLRCLVPIRITVTNEKPASYAQ